MLRKHMNIKELLSQLEEEIEDISVHHHTGGYEDRKEALETLRELQVKLFAIPDVVNHVACEHEEKLMQGDGFTYVVCAKCGMDM